MTTSGQQALFVGKGIFHGPGMMAPLRLRDGRLKLRVLVDRGSIEVFADQGQVVITRGWFPPDGNRALSLVTERRTIRLVSLELRVLKSAWRE